MIEEKRLYILSEDEIHETFAFPKFSSKDREFYITLEGGLWKNGHKLGFQVKLAETSPIYYFFLGQYLSRIKRKGRSIEQ